MRDIIAGIIFIGLVIFLLRGTFPFAFDDLSKASKYRFFDVPVTQNMVEKLSICSPYSRSYKYPLFRSLWNPYFKGHFSFKITPQSNGYCRISALNPHYYVKYDVPVELTQYIGRLMSEYCFSSEYDLAKLKQFISCIGEKNYSDGDQYIIDALKDIEDYMKKRHTMNTNNVRTCIRRITVK